ncbi:MAG: FHA domain-containing protein [Chloroflexota bacterium]
MSEFTLIISIIEDQDDAQNEPSPDPISVAIVDSVTLGRGDGSDNVMQTNTIGQRTPQQIAESEFQQSMRELTNPHVDLERFFAHQRGVSRRHARIKLREMRMTVEDLGSTNGTYLNNERLESNTEYPLSEKDELRLGFLTLSIKKV